MSKIKILCAITVVAFVGLQGCATNNSSTDPSKVSFLGGFSHKLGMNEALDGELESRKAKSVQLQQELKGSREKLRVSKSRLEELESRLSATKYKSNAAKEKKGKIVAELRLRKRDLNNKEKELADLEKRIKALKAEKVAKKETLIRLAQAESELSDAKQEIAVLTDHLEAELFLKAENALLYD